MSILSHRELVDHYFPLVQAGAELLDKGCPGWERKIRIPDLDLADLKFCMLGQVYGSYGEGAGKLASALQQARAEFESRYNNSEVRTSEYGFEVSGDPEIDNTNPKQYSVLTELWTELIQQRLNPKPMPEAASNGKMGRDSHGRFVKVGR